MAPRSGDPASLVTTIPVGDVGVGLGEGLGLGGGLAVGDGVGVGSGLVPDESSPQLDSITTPASAIAFIRDVIRLP